MSAELNALYTMQFTAIAVREVGNSSQHLVVSFEDCLLLVCCLK